MPENYWQLNVQLKKKKDKFECQEAWFLYFSKFWDLLLNGFKKILEKKAMIIRSQ